jgi:glycosyltransferase involved in cell wall biosynthesis
MPKLALNFICKNEAHLIERMLNSALSITNLVVAVDTGSTDGTQDLIRKICASKGVECHVFDRPFDNFENSRNYAMQKLKEIVNFSSDVWGYFFDCDEVLNIDSTFNKANLNKDLYMINTFIGSMKYTRNTFFRCSLPFRFYGPVHEFIVCDKQDITSDIMTGLSVNVFMEGASWKGDVSAKYFHHAQLLEDYVNYKNSQDVRWLFYLAQSYHDSATIPNNKAENDERLRRAAKYYKLRSQLSGGYVEEIFYSQYRMATCMKVMDSEPWSVIHAELLKAISIDPERAEPIKVIIDHYQSMNEWNLAYLYSKFAVSTYHNNNPYPRKLLFIDLSLYEWKLLESHATSCLYTNRKDEAKQSFNILMSIVKSKPTLFNKEELARIEQNSKIFANL